MTRLTRLVTACALTSVITGAAIAACGVRPGSPGELPPMAPRPGAADPTTRRLPRAPWRSGESPTAASPSLVTVAAVVPVPEFAPVVGEPRDAGTGDGYSPPLPPLPDGGLPSDGRMEPRVQDQ
jgi:hypothetical protein